MHLPATLCNQVPSAVIWDGSEQGLIFAAHHLPARGAGLVACLNRPTRLYHLPSLKPNATAANTDADADAGTGTDMPPPITCC